MILTDGELEILRYEVNELDSIIATSNDEWEVDIVERSWTELISQKVVRLY